MSTIIDSLMSSAVAFAARVTGKSIILRREIPGIYDELTGITGPPTVKNYPTLTVGPPANYDESVINGTAVQVGDMWLAVAASALKIVPTETTDSIIMDGQQWTVIDVGREYSGDDVLLYTMQLRK